MAPSPPPIVGGVAGEAIAAPVSGGIDNGPSADRASSYPTGKDGDPTAGDNDDRSAGEQDGTHAKGTMTSVGLPTPRGGGGGTASRRVAMHSTASGLAMNGERTTSGGVVATDGGGVGRGATKAFVATQRLQL